MRFGRGLILAAALVAMALPALAQGVTVSDQRLTIRMEGRRISLAARVFRPEGEGPFPLVTINHGAPVSLKDVGTQRLGYSRGARWFAAHGYLVVVALRPGFGASDGPFLERVGPCDDRDYVGEGRETAAVERAIVESAARLPDVDPTRIVVLGQSAGGFGAIALGEDPPPGVLGVIDFAGGRGGDDHEHICSGAAHLVQAAGTLGAGNRAPELWLWAANDHFFPPAVGHAMYQAYRAGSRAPVRFVDLPAYDDDGHYTFDSADASVWGPAVLQFLDRIGAAPGN